MTAVIVLQQRDAIHIVSDSAGTDGENLLCEFVRKIFVLKECRSAIVVRGTAVLNWEIIDAIGSTCRSIQEIAGKLMTIVEDITSSPEFKRRPAREQDFSIYVIGWAWQVQRRFHWTVGSALGN